MVSTVLVGQVLDEKYRIERPLGKGGMGTVYLAMHIGTGRPVAVKVIAPDFMERAEFVERFRREAQAAGRLRHPNVVDVTDFGFSETENGPEVAYLVMEYLDGCTLGEILDEEKKLPVGWSIDIIEQVCSAISEAHRQGIIHRDLKPDNIWLEPNQRGGYTVKVLDFGIAKLEETELGYARDELEKETGSPEAAMRAFETFVEGGDAITLTDERSRTLVSEQDTLAIEPEEPEAHTDDSANTSVQSSRRSGEVNLEGGTAIMDPGPGSPGTVGEAKLTVLAGKADDTERDRTETPYTAALTRMGAVLGTPLYMSPEQCRGEKLTPRSDIYSLAVIAYQMFGGTLPFGGDHLQVMEGHKNQEPPPLVAKKVKKKLRKTVMDALSKDPDQRPDTAEAFANKLRANSEGLWSLLSRAFVIFAERLPKFLTLAFLTFLPYLIITFSNVGVKFLVAASTKENPAYLEIAGLVLGLLGYFVQVVSVALLTGMTTWVVGQILAYPLRPLHLRAAFREVWSKFRTLAATVVIGHLITFVGLVLFFFPGVWLGARFFLIAPSVMMEGVRGRKAFRRSIELTKRSFGTVFGAVLLIYLVPFVLMMGIGLTINSVAMNFEQERTIARMEKEGVAPKAQPAESTAKKPEDEGGLNISFGKRSVTIGEKADTDESPNSKAVLAGIHDLIMSPILILLSAFNSVIAALIYFKTRQAGGESMQELLGKLNSANSPRSKWQQRVNERLVQSGRISSGSGTA